MKTVNSLSGGKTSSYIAANYPADYDVFALVRTSDKNCMFPDKKLRQEVSDRIGQEFIGTLEDDMIIYTMLDLEQYIGRKITWVTGRTFDEITKRGNGNTYLANKVQRFCTQYMKVDVIADWWYREVNELIDMRIGFRANETNRAANMNARANKDGLHEKKIRVEINQDKNDKWKTFQWRTTSFPLIEDNIYKDSIENYWKDKPVRFAWMNNCVGCFHRSPLLLNKMAKLHPNKMEWFAKQERESINNATWRSDNSYDDIISWNSQYELFEDDFNECDSGYCGL